MSKMYNKNVRLARAIDELYRKKFEERKPPLGKSETENRMLVEEERREKARKRTRGPYRKSSRAGI